MKGFRESPFALTVNNIGLSLANPRPSAATMPI
jgi:hypothetical protein